MKLTAVQEPFFWAGVNDQVLSTILDKNAELLIGLWLNTKLGVYKTKHFMWIILSSFRKLYSYSVLEFYSMLNFYGYQNQMISKLMQIPWQ